MNRSSAIEQLRGHRAELRRLGVSGLYLFGSVARDEARPDSDVDLCVVTDHAGRQIPASRRLSEAILEVWPRPAFTLIPITPERLNEKRAVHDPFFETVLRQGVLLATEDVRPSDRLTV